MPHYATSTPFLLILGWLLILCMGIAACSGTQTRSQQEQSYLEFDVVPQHATIYVDDQYQGEIHGWHQQVMPVEPGHRRIELRADGYLTQRFDLEVSTGRWLTLRARLQPTIDTPRPADADDDDDHHPPSMGPQRPVFPDEE